MLFIVSVGLLICAFVCASILFCVCVCVIRARVLTLYLYCFPFSTQTHTQDTPHFVLRNMAKRTESTRWPSILDCLPTDVLSYVIELSLSRLEEVAPLALVSKRFNACAKRPHVHKGLQLSTHKRLLRFSRPGTRGVTAKRKIGLALVQMLRQVRSGCSGISGIDLGATADNKRFQYVRDEHVRLVASFPSLRTVLLTQCRFVTDIGPLQSLHFLTKLNLGYCVSIPPQGFACLSSLTSLQELDVRGTTINDEGLAGLSSLTSLQELDVRGTTINDEGLAGLSRSLSALTQLSLCHCKSISGSGFASLSSLTSLQELHVGVTAINDEGLAGLSRSLPALTKLDLYRCAPISSAGFACLSSLTTLQELDVGGTKIEDKELAGLSGSLPALTNLDLSCCHSISGSGFACLSSLTSLQTLDVGGTKIEDEGFAGLLRSLPALSKLDSPGRRGRW